MYIFTYQIHKREENRRMNDQEVKLRVQEKVEEKKKIIKKSKREKKTFAPAGICTRVLSFLPSTSVVNGREMS